MPHFHRKKANATQEDRLWSEKETHLAIESRELRRDKSIYTRKHEIRLKRDGYIRSKRQKEREHGLVGRWHKNKRCIKRLCTRKEFLYKDAGVYF